MCEGRAGRGRRGEPKKKRRPSSRCGALSDAPSTQGGRPFLWARLGTSLAYPQSCRLAGGARGRSQRAPERARVRKKRCAVRGASWREQKKWRAFTRLAARARGSRPPRPAALASTDTEPLRRQAGSIRGTRAAGARAARSFLTAPAPELSPTHTAPPLSHLILWLAPHLAEQGVSFWLGHGGWE